MSIPVEWNYKTQRINFKLKKLSHIIVFYSMYPGKFYNNINIICFFFSNKSIVIDLVTFQKIKFQRYFKIEPHKTLIPINIRFHYFLQILICAYYRLVKSVYPRFGHVRTKGNILEIDVLKINSIYTLNITRLVCYNKAN